MRTQRKLLLAVSGTIVAVVAVTLYAQSAGAGRAVSPTAQVQRPQLTRLQVDVFELRCRPDQLMSLDLMALGQTDAGPMKASPEQVLERLRQLGETALAVRYDNFVDLVSGTRLVSGKSVPTVSDVSISSTGVVIPAVRYDGIGFQLSVKGNWLDESEPNLSYIDFDLESSGLAEHGIDLARMEKETPLTLPVYNQFLSQQRVVARQGLPVLLACNDLSKATSPDGKVAVLVARLVATRLTE